MNIFPSESTTGTLGTSLTLTCLADIVPNSIPTQDVTFEWFFGPSISSLPSGVVKSNMSRSDNTYTSTLQFSPLQLSHEGMYTCQLWGNERLVAKTTISVNGTGIGLRLRGKLYGNDSNILITNIGEGDEGALLCFTDLVQCCRKEHTSDKSRAFGKWLYPNGSDVGIYDDAEEFYRNRGPSRVRLNRRNDTTSPVGSFCCEVPDAMYANITLCVNIGEL